MDETVKKRLVGAIVLVALAVIFVPFLLEEKKSPPQSAVELDTKIPVQPTQKFRSGLVPDEKTATQEVIRSESREKEFHISEKLDLTEHKRLPETVSSTEPGSRSVDEKKRSIVEATGSSSKPVTSSQPEKREVEKIMEKKQPSSKSGWVIQAGSFGKKTNADNLQKNISKIGLLAYIEEIDVQGKALYRVRVGPFDSKSKAQQHLKMVEKEFDLKGRVINLK